MKWRTGTWATLVLLALLVPRGASAQVPDKTPAFVYAVTANSGQGYEPAFYPPAVRTVYLMADQPNILAPRSTLIYWWPITNEWKPDWEARNDVVEGTLEVWQGAQLALSADLTPYVIQYHTDAPVESLQLYTGDEATAHYQAFTQARDDYFTSLRTYNDRMAEYQRQLEEAVQKSQGGTVPQQVPTHPVEPDTFTLLSSAPARAFIVTLAEGEYRLRMRDGRGLLVPDSERRLVVFGPRRRGIGYVVLPQAKWTVPEQSDEPGNVVYAPNRNTLYLQPFTEAEYNERNYTLLHNPQSLEGRADHWVWVHLHPQPAAFLELRSSDRPPRRIQWKPYRVNQIPGAALGYEVVEFDATTMHGTPSFEGYEIVVDSSQPSFTVQLLDSNGQALSGSQRGVRQLRESSTWALFGVPCLPLGLGLLLRLRRRQRLAPLPPSAR